jgi:hypothetical protein
MAAEERKEKSRRFSDAFSPLKLSRFDRVCGDRGRKIQSGVGGRTATEAGESDSTQIVVFSTPVSS